ncbi:DUF3301 domain-containing protein [Alteromonas sp. 345S023]|uniref:DUF3301 domain-containing protein n=1 Tax=Alteromonas profundi TaxID=2696062 RepID=A0A7X5LI52_9ALTE|nr:DUF3301 domain-containing protein [Alteromonas profundi]NDV89795.1 DUF3301 domain-containing protein [Alteromonas profundi]
MSLLEVIVWLLLGFVAFQFWRVRSISEIADRYIKQYCDNHNLQLLNTARKKTRLTFKYRKPDWYSLYAFEFSANGEDRYEGEIALVGQSVIRTTLPPYRMN